MGVSARRDSGLIVIEDRHGREVSFYPDEFATVTTQGLSIVAEIEAHNKAVSDNSTPEVKPAPEYIMGVDVAGAKKEEAKKKSAPPVHVVTKHTGHKPVHKKGH